MEIVKRLQVTPFHQYKFSHSPPAKLKYTPPNMIYLTLATAPHSFVWLDPNVYQLVLYIFQLITILAPKII